MKPFPIVAFYLLFVKICLAATFYVSPSGSNSNSGTEQDPWRTLQWAADKAQPGDTIEVREGDYVEFVWTKREGTSAAPITFKGEAGARVGGFRISHSYYRLIGFEITGANVPLYQGTVEIRSGVDFVRIENCTFKDIPDSVCAVRTDPGTQPLPTNLTISDSHFIDIRYIAISVLGSHHTIERNYFSTKYGADALRILSSYTLVKNNRFQNWSNLVDNQNHTDLIQSFSNNKEVSQHVVIEGNLAIDCVNTQIGNIGDTDGQQRVSHWQWRNNTFINVDFAMSIAAPHFQLLNNTFYRSGRNTGHPIILRYFANPALGRAHYSVLYNNLFVECGATPTNTIQGWYGSDSFDSLQGLEADYNHVVGQGAGSTKTGFRTESRELHGINGAETMMLPLLDDVSVPVPSNLTRGTGKNLDQFFSDDAKGTARGTSWDVGAFQSMNTDPASAPKKPTELTIQ